LGDDGLFIGGVVNNWKILKKLKGKIHFCKCIHCGIEREVFNSQLKDVTIDPEKARCRNCTKLKVGSDYTTNRGFKYKIKEYISAKKVLIKFEPDDLCPEGYERYVAKYYVKDGCIDYPFERSVSEIGYMGYLRKDFKANPHIFSLWDKMIKRCYNPTLKDKSYLNCNVCEEWHNFYNFHKWYEIQMNNGFYQKGYQLDKDILNPMAKEYSPENCRLVPESINSFTNNNTDSRDTKLPSGVSWKAKNNKYQVSIKSGHKSNKYLGLFTCPKEGYEIYKLEKIKAGLKLANEWEGLVVPDIIAILRNYKCPEWDWVNNKYLVEE